MFLRTRDELRRLLGLAQKSGRIKVFFLSRPSRRVGLMGRCHSVAACGIKVLCGIRSLLGPSHSLRDQGVAPHRAAGGAAHNRSGVSLGTARGIKVFFILIDWLHLEYCFVLSIYTSLVTSYYYSCSTSMP
jgi:hypothetical protein